MPQKLRKYKIIQVIRYDRGWEFYLPIAENSGKSTGNRCASMSIESHYQNPKDNINLTDLQYFFLIKNRTTYTITKKRYYL